MDFMDNPRHWFEQQIDNPYINRRSFLISDKPTITEHYKCKDLLHAVQTRLSDVENKLQILEDQNKTKAEDQGSQGIEITSSFEALLFWLRLMEKKADGYSRRMGVDTEFGTRIRVVKRRIRVLVKKSNI